MAGDAYTGLKRRKQTPWSVRFGDAIASRVIAVGGIGTIAAILLVVLVLLGTALPLFQRPTYGDWYVLDSSRFRHVGIDEYALILWGMDDDGNIESRSLIDGALLEQFPIPGLAASSEVGSSEDGGSEDAVAERVGSENADAEAKSKPLQLTSTNVSIDRSTLIAGFSDGSIRLAKIEFKTKLLSPNDVPDGVSLSEESPVAVLENSIFQWISSTGVRRTSLDEIKWSEPKQLGSEPVTAVDFIPDNTANRLSRKTTSYALGVVGEELVFATIKGTKGLGGRVTEKIEVASCPMQVRNEKSPLSAMLINGTDHAVLVWADGTLDRYALGGEQIELTEVSIAFTGGEGRVTCAAPLLARQTVMVGLDDGSLQGWMVVQKSDGSESANKNPPKIELSSDNYRLALAHEIKVGDAALVSLTSSQQNHVAVTSDENGETALIYVTTDSLLSKIDAPLEGRIESLSLDPSGDTLVAASADSVGLVEFDIGYPESSFRSFFGRVWYEGHDRPKYIWQSSAGTEKSEIKISLIPLVFGTLKATVYAMLVSIPLAIMAAIYTSEFLTPSVRSKVKPVIELMASLPSVVLGYIAALVMAPYLQEHLMAMLAGLLVVPGMFIVAGNLWNLLPVDWLVRLQSLRLLVMLICLPIALWLSVFVGGIAETLFFDGSILLWLSSGEGSAVGGWMLITTPFVLVGATLLFFGPLADYSRRTAMGKSPRAYSLYALVRLVVMTAAAIFVALGVSWVFSSVGWDLRGSFFDSYQDRNALLVGGALGFCVIPIIYTLSDDALQAVPKQLRSASLGCGATPWQTTMRVVVPSAMSGLFSAVMIGLGRAVGETMVVLMAAGNTPVMEWNPFNGFRTLSATLATELPEAAKGSTHFRTLFLAALLLFFLTLIANTLAEFVRIRFRKRASQL